MTYSSHHAGAIVVYISFKEQQTPRFRKDKSRTSLPFGWVSYVIVWGAERVEGLDLREWNGR